MVRLTIEARDCKLYSRGDLVLYVAHDAHDAHDALRFFVRFPYAIQIKTVNTGQGVTVRVNKLHSIAILKRIGINPHDIAQGNSHFI